MKKSVWAWALIDWGNSAFATTVMAGFFPIFFKTYWAAGLGDVQSTYLLGFGNSMASLLFAMMAPLIGAWADIRARKKLFLGGFTVLGAICSLGLAAISSGEAGVAIAVYALASVGFAGSSMFCDALLMDIAEEKDFDWISGIGYATGYLGGGILFAVNVAMTLKPEFFGLSSAADAVKISFISVGAWWLIFTFPALIYIRERSVKVQKSYPEALKNSFSSLSKTLKECFNNRNLALFFISYFLYIDGVNTTIKMAVDYGLSIGFESKDLITALLIVQFVGFPAAVLFGWLGEKWDAKKSILLGLLVYVGTTVWATQMRSPSEFYGLAMMIGLVQGGVQALSRSFFARLTPKDKTAEYFGLFNMVGKFSTVLGPWAVGATAVLTGSSRMSLLAILAFFFIGGAGLVFVREKSGS